MTELMPTPVDYGLPAKFSTWRDLQFDAVNYMLDTPQRFVGVCAPTGSGKSLMYMAAAVLSGKRTVVLTSTKGLQDQLQADFAELSTDIRGMQNYICAIATQFGFPHYTRVGDAPCQMGAQCHLRGSGCGYFDQYRVAQAADIIVTNYQCWMYDLKRGGGGLGKERPVEMLIADECFAAGTLVGSTAIEHVGIGDAVLSFNETMQRMEKRIVRKVFRKIPEAICRLNFSDGSNVTCTLNHPFYTDKGWLPAYRLLLGNVLCLRHATKILSRSDRDAMCSLHEAPYADGYQAQVPVPPKWAGGLFSGMRFLPWYPQKLGLRPGTGTAANAEAQSHAQPVGKSKTERDIESNGMEASNSGGERSRAIHLSEIASFDTGVADGSGNTFGNEEMGTEETFFADVLQGRYSALCFASCHRSGREFPSCTEEPKIGCQEGSSAHWSWVEGFEIYKPSDREGFKRLCPDGYVYNLEVEGTHTYTANGFVVHNCHDAVDQLCSYLSVELERKECLSLGVTWPLSGYDQQQWVDWAHYWCEIIEERQENLAMEVKTGVAAHSAMHEIKELKTLIRKLDTIQGMRDEWVIEEAGVDAGTMKAVKFDPLWPKRYAEGVLFREVPKVVMVSATVRPKTAELLGVPEEELAFKEYESSFPVSNRPVIHVPTVRMNYRTEQDDNQMMWLLRRIDQLVGARGDRKGIIHTVSYKRARFLVDNSKHAGRMMVHGSDTRERTIERFREAGPGAVLVSPSVDTGYDFHDDLARYQIIMKIPYPDTRGAVLKARTGQDRDYPMYVTSQTLQQMTGRVVRSETDWAETLIVDDSFRWVFGKYKRYFSRWFQESVRTSGMKLPEPL